MIDSKLLQLYNRSKQRKYSKLFQEEPSPSKLVITSKDVENKFVYRYFVRHTNDEGTVMEVNKSTYENFKKNARFVTAKIKWKIVGKKYEQIRNGIIDLGVYEYNLQAVSKADLTFGGLLSYIIDYLEFWVAEV